MSKLLFITLMCVISYCSGSAAAGTDEAKPGSVDGMSDSVRILRLTKPLKLDCNTTKTNGDPQEVFWYKEGEQVSSDDNIEVRIDGTLFFKASSEEDIGHYSCSTTGGEEIQVYTLVTLSYTPLAKSTTAIEGDKLTLTCEPVGKPMPRVYWSKNNKTIVEDERTSFESKDGKPENATLVITNVTQADRDLYICTFDNTDGAMVFTTSTSVRVKDLYAALWPFLGIVFEVVLLCLVIFIYEKRRTKNDFEESDTDNNMKGGR